MRTSEKDLQNIVDRINVITNSPRKAYENNEAKIGNYCLYFAYGGVALHRITNSGGGIREIISMGTKKELYGKLQSFLNGIQAGKEVV